MVDAPTGTLLQVEINTIASSFACLSALTGAACASTPHRASLSAGAGEMHAELLPRLGLSQLYPPASLPANGAMEAMAGGLAAAWREVGLLEAVVLFVVQPGERNAFDQHWLQARRRGARRRRAARSLSPARRRRCGGRMASARCGARWRRCLRWARWTRAGCCVSGGTQPPWSTSARATRPMITPPRPSGTAAPSSSALRQSSAPPSGAHLPAPPATRRA